MHRPAVPIDVRSVGLIAQDCHAGSQFPINIGRNLICGAMRAIHDDRHPFQIEPLMKGLLDELDVAAFGVINAKCLSNFRGGRPQGVNALGKDEFLDLPLLFIRQLQSVSGEKLDAVVLIGIVRSGDHHAGVRAQTARKERDGRCRQRPHQQYVHAHGTDAGRQCGLNHIARQACILADHNAVASGTRLEDMGGRSAQPECDFASDGFDIRHAANAIRPEQLAHGRRLCAFHHVPPLGTHAETVACRIAQLTQATSFICATACTLTI